MKEFRAYRHEAELMLLPPSLAEWVPADHEIHFIREAVDRLDMSAITGAYAEAGGNPPYDPKLMVRILFFAYARGVRSSRRIERLLHESVPMRVLACNQQPDHWTIAHFRKRHLEALGELFVQTVLLAKLAGLVKLGHVAIDGTKIKANASKHTAMSYGHMQKESVRLREEIGRHLRTAVAEDEAEDRKLGGRRGDELPADLANAAKRRAVIERAMAALEEAARRGEVKLAKAERAAATPDGPEPVHPEEATDSALRADTGAGARPLMLPVREAESPSEPVRPAEKETPPSPSPAVAPAATRSIRPHEKVQYNFTDPQSRIMLTGAKTFEQCYNAQAAVDAATQVIVGAELTNMAADCPHLITLVKQVVANTGWVPAEVSADAGYFSADHVQTLQDMEIDPFIPPDRIRHDEWRRQSPPRGRIPRNLDPKGRMRRKLRTRNGRARYRLRQQSVEPVFGQIKSGRGLQQFLLRGLKAVRASWRFECAVHNVLKLWRAGAQMG
ncbi:MAG: IS1182 family transposase [Clostridia bacterium]